jgi:enterobactin synthetase component D
MKWVIPPGSAPRRERQRQRDMKPLTTELPSLPHAAAARLALAPTGSSENIDLTQRLLAASPALREISDTLFEASAHDMGPSGASCALSLARLDTALGTLPLEPFLCDGVLRAVRPRQLAWLAGRLCAEHALHAIGVPQPRGVARGPTGAPHWPGAALGSITHTAATAHAAVRPGGSCFGVGIDSELVDTAASSAIAEFCCTPFERARWLATSGDATTLVLIFSAKESFYKAVYRSVGRFIGFDEVEVIAMDPWRGTLVLLPVPGGELASRFGPLPVRFSIEPGRPARVHTTLVIDHAPRLDD